MANRFQRLQTVEVPQKVMTENGPDFIWTKSRDGAGFRATNPPIERLYHGKVRGNDSGRTKRAAWYRSRSKRWMCSHPKQQRRKAKQVSPKVDVPEQEFKITLSKRDEGFVEIMVRAKGSENAAGKARRDFPEYVVEVVEVVE